MKMSNHATEHKKQNKTHEDRKNLKPRKELCLTLFIYWGNDLGKQCVVLFILKIGKRWCEKNTTNL